MNAWYWDYSNNTTTAGTDTTAGWDNVTDSTATATTTGNAGNVYRRFYYVTPSYSGTISTNDLHYYIPKPRKVLVETPEHWNDEDVRQFVCLVNDETDTGWKVTMVIKGDIAITDPNVEKRTMADFVPLLKNRASAADRDKIVSFFQAHPTTPPAT